MPRLGLQRNRHSEAVEKPKPLVALAKPIAKSLDSLVRLLGNQAIKRLNEAEPAVSSSC